MCVCVCVVFFFFNISFVLTTFCFVVLFFIVVFAFTVLLFMSVFVLFFQLLHLHTIRHTFLIGSLAAAAAPEF